MNWKLRLKNKTTLTALIAGIAALIYQILTMIGITPKISESTILETAGMLINILCLLGIVVDPTTKGIADSERAMEYEKPSEGDGE